MVFLLSHHPGWPYEGGVGVESPAGERLGVHEAAVENLRPTWCVRVFI